MGTKAKSDSQRRIDKALRKHGLKGHPVHWSWYAVAAALCMAGAWWQWG